MHESPQELERLQQLLDESAAAAGPHLGGIIDEERRVDAVSLCRRLQGMRLLVVATVTADGRPLAGPVDGYFLHGSFSFSSGRDSVRMRHLAARPAVSATYLPSEEFAFTVHGRAQLFDVLDPAQADLQQAMLDFYLPKQEPAFEARLPAEDHPGQDLHVPDVAVSQVAERVVGPGARRVRPGPALPAGAEGAGSATWLSWARSR
jgi:hypothetical protein